MKQNKVTIKTGQGDIISPKLVTLVFEDVFKGLNWNDKGINIQGERLKNLKFTNDLMIFTQNQNELIGILKDPKLEAEKVGLQINM